MLYTISPYVVHHYAHVQASHLQHNQFIIIICIVYSVGEEPYKERWRDPQTRCCTMLGECPRNDTPSPFVPSYQSLCKDLTRSNHRYRVLSAEAALLRHFHPWEHSLSSLTLTLAMRTNDHSHQQSCSNKAGSTSILASSAFGFH
jgi:hypothetical protein